MLEATAAREVCVMKNCTSGDGRTLFVRVWVHSGVSRTAKTSVHRSDRMNASSEARGADI